MGYKGGGEDPTLLSLLDSDLTVRIRRTADFRFPCIWPALMVPNCFEAPDR